MRNDGKNFGFVESTYIPNQLIIANNLTDKLQIEGLAVLEFNKERQANSWKMITII